MISKKIAGPPVMIGLIGYLGASNLSHDDDAHPHHGFQTTPIALGTGGIVGETSAMSTTNPVWMISPTTHELVAVDNVTGAEIVGEHAGFLHATKPRGPQMV